jgi:gamma-glutamyl hercynylcysteine S-oxide synthase
MGPGTRDPGKSWPEAIASLMFEIGADGINGDTQDGVPRAFSDAADRIGHRLAFEPENGPHDEAVAYNVLTWGEYTFPLVPRVGPVQMARAEVYGEYFRPLESRKDG